MDEKKGAGQDYQKEIEARPKGYPGGIGEAVQQMDIWDGAVEALDREGVVDVTRVGIIGFSRTGWHVEYSLVHSRVRYAAATVADNVKYSVGEYLLNPSSSQIEEQMYGGSPFGAGLDSWRHYSISFNLDKIHTPILMEGMGNGVHDDRPEFVPRSLGVQKDVAFGLTRLKKPIELYYYPNEEHAPDHPRARLASVARNVDWFRFWLQGYERPNPEDPDQYKRWEHLRELRDADASAAPD